MDRHGDPLWMPGVLAGCRRRDTGGGAMNIPEHPDVAAIQRTGYPSWIECENKDTMAELKEYATEYALEIIKWLLDGYPGIIREFSEYATGYGATTYQDWLN